MTSDAEPVELDSLEVTMVDVSSLIEDVDNANTHPQRSLDVICDSLKRFGQVEPLIVRHGTNVVIGGNGRLRAMRELGWTRCAVHYFDGSDHEAKALALVLNRSAQFAEWDKEMLESQLTDLKDVGFDLPELGFDDDELDLLFPDEPESPPEFPEVDESIETEHECPRCGYRFSGGKAPVSCTDDGGNPDD